ncbi:ubiquinol-cytochrome-c reductase complex assembly factor 1 [Dermacentor albipictus]|uniref:ubiquinol-cytochrome-c reductase complex assembly factor 1 n=1 Tax=Dermacentor albipictus TaxID=60249 RepID=UPI0031FDA025
MSLRVFPSLFNRAARYTGCRPALLVCARKSMHVHAASESPIRPAASVAVGSRWERIKASVKWQFVTQDETRAGSVFIYESCVDRVDYRTFFSYFKLQDTFLSWFLVAELHVWMCMTRAMAELDDRRALCLQRELPRNLWNDTEKRIGKIGYIPTKLKRESLAYLSDHFNAMLLLYDEGLQGDDKALASALWRVFLMCEGREPVALETLVHYVRKQIHMLDKMTLDQFIAEHSISWTPLLDCESKKQY